LERSPKNPGGSKLFHVSRDKTISGEYILEKNPKRPGGLFCFDTSLDMLLSVVLTLILADFAAGENSEVEWQSESNPTSNKWRNFLSWAVTVLVKFLYLLYRLGLQCQHEEQFEHAVGVLISRLEIDLQHKSSLNSVLWQRYNNDVRLWVENDARRRIVRFFKGIESEICDSSSIQSCRPNEFVIAHFNLTDARRFSVPEKVKRDLSTHQTFFEIWHMGIQFELCSCWQISHQI